MNDLLIELMQKLDSKAGRFAMLDRYYQGTPPLAFLAPEAKKALGNRFGVLGSNLCKLAVTALSERLRVTGFTVDGGDSTELWADWLRNDLDQLAPVAHREALTLGSSFVIVWADPAGLPSISVEDARQVDVLVDPGTRETVAAVKRWNSKNATHAVLYGPDVIRSTQSGFRGRCGRFQDRGEDR